MLFQGNTWHYNYESYLLFLRCQVMALDPLFTNIETLVKTLGHERTHIYQVKSFGHPDTLINGFEHLQLNEKAAYTLENSYWQYYQKNKSGLFDHYGDQYVSRLAKNNP